MTELRGLRDDPIYQQLQGDERTEYERCYRKTLAGQYDELRAAASAFAQPLMTLTLWLLTKLDRLVAPARSR